MSPVTAKRSEAVVDSNGAEVLWESETLRKGIVLVMNVTTNPFVAISR